MDILFKRLGLFLLGASLPAAVMAAIYTFLLGNCDPKFGCDGTLGFYLKLSIVPVALVSGMTMLIAMKLFGQRCHYNGFLLVLTGVLVSVVNTVTISVAQDYGFILLIIGIVALTLLVFWVTFKMKKVEYTYK
ncbi:MAG: hypothetical protein GJ680_12780 [Alteromonadaceae bacterium]|nr:hypothetical protein [Alteromonadaceae bacterium]